MAASRKPAIRKKDEGGRMKDEEGGEGFVFWVSGWEWWVDEVD